MARSDAARTTRPDKALARMVESSKAPAISRAAAVLRLLGKSDTPIGVHTIARELGLVPSTCLHVLRALVAEQLAAFDPDTKRYSLDAGVLTLARQWLRRNRFSDLAQPVIERIPRGLPQLLARHRPYTARTCIQRQRSPGRRHLHLF